MAEITKVKTQSFMEALDTEGISNEARRQIIEKAELHYEELIELVLTDYVPTPDLPFFINVLRAFLAAIKIISPEHVELALQMLPEEKLQQDAEEFLSEENDSEVIGGNYGN